jgi:hypothetical protein
MHELQFRRQEAANKLSGRALATASGGSWQVRQRENMLHCTEVSQQTDGALARTF